MFLCGSCHNEGAHSGHASARIGECEQCHRVEIMVVDCCFGMCRSDVAPSPLDLAEKLTIDHFSPSINPLLLENAARHAVRRLEFVEPLLNRLASEIWRNSIWCVDNVGGPNQIWRCAWCGFLHDNDTHELIKHANDVDCHLPECVTVIPFVRAKSHRWSPAPPRAEGE